MSPVLEVLTLVLCAEHSDRSVKMAAQTRTEHQTGLGERCLPAQVEIKANCLFNKYLPNIYCLPETALDAGDTAVNKQVFKNVQPMLGI